MSIWRKILVVLGFGSVPDICKMSKSGRDYNDYPKRINIWISVFQ